MRSEFWPRTGCRKARRPEETVHGRSTATTHRRWLRWTIGSLVGLLVLVVGGLSLRFTSAPRRPRWRCPGTAEAGRRRRPRSTASGTPGPGPSPAGGLQQSVIGQQSTLVGRTGKVWGSLTVSGGSVSQGTFAVDMAAATSGLSKTSQTVRLRRERRPDGHAHADEPHRGGHRPQPMGLPSVCRRAATSPCTG